MTALPHNMLWHTIGHFGFTLAELLIALAILGAIATFTIPKILSSQQNQRYNAAAKEAISAISQAYHLYTYNGNSITSGMHAKDIIDPYLNYVAIDTVTQVDTNPTSGTASITCGGNADNNCYRLHSGALLRPSNCSLGGTSNLYSFRFTFDPDGINTGIQNSLTLVLYANGRITSLAKVQDGTTGGNGCVGPLAPDPATDPSWFSW
jgi:prepilin-type N-terminal cleavage/methylation domain-containing protein